ncbi:Xaa-Pro aminopeptidase [Pseudomonas sp. WJP1]|uniref:aminopeptidase P family protein n=1 Tax=Pseudomonas sp. WJP1 TaxID=2986947 RepID=UPI0023499809|nr:aminopeptidase P family protein [Pseudomonas sp. WJP1]WCM54067.1 Xaa-Pro aminopeptidase [Pseudomonas sp. WJP1]
MFSRNTYIQRRQALRERLGGGLVLLPGNLDAPINFAHNVYPFRQDSTFAYFFGVSRPGLSAVIDLDGGGEAVFGDETRFEDRIWLGEGQPLAQQCAAVGCATVKPSAELQGVVEKALKRGRTVHFLPPYRVETTLLLAQLLASSPHEVAGAASPVLIAAVVALREIKDGSEIEQIEQAMAVAREMHLAAMGATRPGVLEYEVVAAMRSVLGRHGLQEAYQPVFSRRGEILHNLEHGARLEAGDLVVNDAGASTLLGYASDVTRTLPVGGRFLPHQRELYTLLVQVQEEAIATLRPGLAFADVHRLAAQQMVEGMSELGFFKGDTAQVVESGAYAICFPHGLGHQLGLDVHDMEALGEDHVGYDSDVSRSQQFGLCNLRMGKRLQPGMVLTVEPGIYFIPGLIEQWHAQKRHAGMICYERFKAYAGFGGMRVEDVVAIGTTSARVLGPHIPKRVGEVEAAMS